MAVKSGKRSARALPVDVFNTKGKVIGKISLPKEIFGTEVNDKLMGQAVRVYLTNQRQGTVSTKTRGEVKGSTRKLYRQKGTGKARAGSIRSPLRVGGGIVFGPKPRRFLLSLPKKMRKASLFSALTKRFKEKAIQVIDGLEKIEPKTSKMHEVFNKIGLSPKSQSTLLVIPKDFKNVRWAVRNIEGMDMATINTLNTYEVLRHKKILVVKDSLEAMKNLWIK